MQSGPCQWLSLWYQRFVLLALVLTFVDCADWAVNVHRCDSSVCIAHLWFIFDLLVALGGICGLLAIGVGRAESHFHDCYLLLVAYTHHEEFLGDWKARSFWDSLWMLFLWLAVLFERGRNFLLLVDNDKHRYANIHVRQAAHLLLFAISSGALFGLALCLLQVCRGLSLCVDHFCTRAVGDQEKIIEKVHVWNTMQAILRKASHAIELAFVTLQMTIGAIVFSIGIGVALFSEDIADVELFIPQGLVLMGFLRVFFVAASITDKCLRVPALINSLDTGDHDMDRHYVVNFISQSAAGFHVCNVRLESDRKSVV